jgi:hypothetical protein
LFEEVGRLRHPVLVLRSRRPVRSHPARRSKPWRRTSFLGLDDPGQSRQTDVSVSDDDDLRPCVHLKSVKASFSVDRGVDVDLARIPVLSWRWKLTRFPAAADFRHSATDDQAAQVLVAFGDRRVLAYIGDGTARIGAAQIAPSAPLIRICRSGAAETNPKGLRLQINSQHTGAIAESYFGEVGFRSAAQ